SRTSFSLPWAYCAGCRRSATEGNLDQLRPGHTRGQGFGELFAALYERVLPPICGGEVGQPNRLRCVESAVEVFGRGGAGDFESVENRAATVVAHDHLHPYRRFVSRQHHRADVVQEREVAEQHPGHARGSRLLGRERNAGGSCDRAVDASKTAVRVHTLRTAVEHLV